MDKDKQIVSAQVILRAGSGEDAPSPASVTAENVHRYLPSAENFKKAQDYFAKLGFDVQASYGNSFSITGSTARFEKVFNTKLLETEKGGVRSLPKNREESIELPTGKLPKELKKIVTAITFSEPPDFGPTNY